MTPVHFLPPSGCQPTNHIPLPPHRAAQVVHARSIAGAWGLRQTPTLSHPGLVTRQSLPVQGPVSPVAGRVPNRPEL